MRVWGSGFTCEGTEGIIKGNPKRVGSLGFRVWGAGSGAVGTD